jgi:hypothetical protein
VRFRFSPIIPIKNWEDDNARIIDELFSKVQPDIICIETLTHMSVAQLQRSMTPEHLDQDIISQMDEEMSGDSCGPFPHEIRERIYRYFIRRIREVSPETPLVICLETPEMWGALGNELGMDPDNYVCCCGPSCTPENPLLSR